MKLLRKEIEAARPTTYAKINATDWAWKHIWRVVRTQVRHHRTVMYGVRTHLGGKACGL